MTIDSANLCKCTLWKYAFEHGEHFMDSLHVKIAILYGKLQRKNCWKLETPNFHAARTSPKMRSWENHGPMVDPTGPNFCVNCWASKHQRFLKNEARRVNTPGLMWPFDPQRLSPPRDRKSHPTSEVCSSFGSWTSMTMANHTWSLELASVLVINAWYNGLW